MKLVVGLGNPGPEYALNRHNAGFIMVDVLADRYSFKPFRRQGKAFLSEGEVNGVRTLLLKPMTWMNLSGQAVGEVARFFRIPLENIVVIHDDLALPFGSVRVKNGGGHGGHNGLRSIDACVGKDYWRVRIGIDHPGDRQAVTGHVLGNFSRDEQNELAFLLERLSNSFPFLLSGDAEAFMLAVAGKKQV